MTCSRVKVVSLIIRGGEPTKFPIALKASRGTHQEISTGNRIKDESIPSGGAHIKTMKKDNGRLLSNRSIMSIANSIPSIF